MYHRSLVVGRGAVWTHASTRVPDIDCAADIDRAFLHPSFVRSSAREGSRFEGWEWP